MFRVSLIAALTAAALIAAAGTASAIGPDSGNGTSINGFSQHGQAPLGIRAPGAAGTTMVGIELPARK